jgi:pimeloyl-ACP methyl ester carboxylesterase
MRKKLTSILLGLSLIYLGTGFLLFIKQRDFLYFPVPSIKHSFDEETFNIAKESIKVTVLNKGRKKAIIYFGGNAESVDYNAYDFSRIFQQHTVYLVKYRGYGGSTGRPEEKAIYSDALHIFDKIKSKYAAVSIIGRSLGSGVATLLASKRNIDKLILITPFDSIENVAQKLYLIYPMSLLLKDKYDSVGRISSITAKTLVIAAEKDQIIDAEHTKRLVNAFPALQITYEVLENTDHNTVSNSEKYYVLLKEHI